MTTTMVNVTDIRQWHHSLMRNQENQFQFMAQADFGTDGFQ